jgi:CheY-like chemotaxis protein
MALQHDCILLVEDDTNDIVLLQLAFERAGIGTRLQILSNGRQAVDYLAGKGEFANRERFPFPRLVLLDLKLPVMSGLDVLKWIQNQPALGSLLVVVLTSSSENRDIDQSYRLGARSFLVKPLSLHTRVDLAKTIKHYWLELNQDTISRKGLADRKLSDCRSD